MFAVKDKSGPESRGQQSRKPESQANVRAALNTYTAVLHAARSVRAALDSIYPALSSMVALSTLKPTRSQISRAVAVYSKNRPTIQRFLLVGFVVHVLRSTLASFASGSSVSSRKSKPSGKFKDDGKPPRVAVRTSTLFISHLSLTLEPGGWRVLSEVDDYSPDRDTQPEVQRSAPCLLRSLGYANQRPSRGNAARYAFQSTRFPNRYLVVCRCVRWKVRHGLSESSAPQTDDAPESLHR
jgi:hypothetical protein